MSTEIIVKKLNKEVKTLRRDVGQLKLMLTKVLSIPEESIKEYTNVAVIKNAFRRALKSH